MSAFVEYKVRANYKDLMEEELTFAQVQRKDGKLYANISTVNDAGSTTIIAVDLDDVQKALDLIRRNVD